MSIFVVKQAVTEALELRISDLIPKFFTHTLILLCPLQTTGAIPAGALQTVPNHLDNLFVIV